MNEDLKVKIPIRFKKNLNSRFRYGNAKMENNNAIIRIKCDLCETYRNHFSCGECPFNKLVHLNGCKGWIEKLTNEIHSPMRMSTSTIKWISPKRDERIRQLFIKLRREARKYIEWVEE